MYTVGAVVDGYELTASGEWVRRSPTAGSPYRLGDVVDEHLLDADLTWVRLRHAPTAPYRAGDVVDGFVLVPDGAWVPLTSRLRERVGGVGDGASRRTEPRVEVADARAGLSAAERTERRAAEQRHATERAAAARRAASQAASAEQRSTDRRTADALAAADRAAERATAALAAGPTRTVPTGVSSSSAVRTTASSTGAAQRPRHQVGDVVNGHVLTPDMRWVPLGSPSVGVTGGTGSSTVPRPQQQARRNGVPPFVPLIVVGFFLLQALRACGG